MKHLTNFDDFANEKKGLWANIHAKRKRGEAPAKPGDEDYPDEEGWEAAQESLAEAEDRDTLAELNEMTLGQLERIADYANMIKDRMTKGEQLESWMYSQLTVSLENLNAVHDAMDGNDGKVE
jgi:hypothetical protein